MFPIPSLLTVAKYGFISMVVTSAGFLIGNVVVVKHHTGEPLDELVYKPRISRHLEDTVPGLDREYSRCFTDPTKANCLGHANEPFRISDHDWLREREDELDSGHRHPIYLLIDDFSSYMTSLGVRVVILEPSMLFCAVSSSNKYNLLIKDFNPHLFQGSPLTVTVGIFEEDAISLDAAIWVESQNNTPAPSFEALRTRRWLIDAESGEHALHSVHFLFSRGPLHVHAVVLFARNAYLWHAGTDLTSRGDLLFTKEGTYENFTAVPLAIGDLKLYLPSSPVQFLSQIPNTEFLNCQPPVDEVAILAHPTLTEDQLVNRAIVALQEMKSLFQPYFVNFWLWTESLNGWFKTCNIFEESYELSVAVSHSSVKRLNLTAVLANSIYLGALETWDGIATLACYGLQINIYICHEKRDSVWYRHKTERETKRLIPFKFRLCSSDVLGQRIYVPCEVEQILQLQREQTAMNAFEQY